MMARRWNVQFIQTTEGGWYYSHTHTQSFDYGRRNVEKSALNLAGPEHMNFHIESWFLALVNYTLSTA
jgi:hypothetical protein